MQGAFGCRLNRTMPRLWRTASLANKSAAAQLASYDAKIELRAAAAAGPSAMCGVAVWLSRHAVFAARRHAACVVYDPNAPILSVSLPVRQLSLFLPPAAVIMNDV